MSKVTQHFETWCLKSGAGAFTTGFDSSVLLKCYFDTQTSVYPVELEALFEYVSESLMRAAFLFVQVTMVSVASPTSNASQKSVALPVNVALGQQILAVQQPTPASPVKVATSQTTTQVKLPTCRGSVTHLSRYLHVTHCSDLNLELFTVFWIQFNPPPQSEHSPEYETSAVRLCGRSRWVPV